jgi:hypothetical protein
VEEEWNSYPSYIDNKVSLRFQPKNKFGKINEKDEQ